MGAPVQVVPTVQAGLKDTMGSKVAMPSIEMGYCGAHWRIDGEHCSGLEMLEETSLMACDDGEWALYGGDPI